MLVFSGWTNPDMLEMTRSPAAPHAEAVARAVNRAHRSDVSEAELKLWITVSGEKISATLYSGDGRGESDAVLTKCVHNLTLRQITVSNCVITELSRR